MSTSYNKLLLAVVAGLFLSSVVFAGDIPNPDHVWAVPAGDCGLGLIGYPSYAGYPPYTDVCLGLGRLSVQLPIYAVASICLGVLLGIMLLIFGFYALRRRKHNVA